MSFYKEVPGRQTTLESTLKFDTTPTEGSTNPVTSDGVKSAIDGAVGDASEALQEQIDEIAEKAGSGYIPKGEASVATLNALSEQENGWLYTLTDAGTLTDGSLAVVAGDTVAWDEANSVWYKAMDYAPRQYGTNEVHNLPTSITAFRTGDVIAVDGPSGTAKMGKDDLLKEAAQGTFKNGIAPQFYTGIDYAVRDLVCHDGKVYRFKNDHPAGAWDADAVAEYSLNGVIERVGENALTFALNGRNISQQRIFGLDSTRYYTIKSSDSWDYSDQTTPHSTFELAYTPDGTNFVKVYNTTSPVNGIDIRFKPVVSALYYTVFVRNENGNFVNFCIEAEAKNFTGNSVKSSDNVSGQSRIYTNQANGIAVLKLDCNIPNDYASTATDNFEISVHNKLTNTFNVIVEYPQKIKKVPQGVAIELTPDIDFINLFLRTNDEVYIAGTIENNPKTKDVSDVPVFTEGILVSKNFGLDATSSLNASCSPVYCKGARGIKVSLDVVADGGSTDAGICFYDEKMDFISGYVPPASGDASHVEEVLVQVPSGAAYFRTSIYTTAIDQFKCVLYFADNSEFSLYKKDENVRVGVPQLYLSEPTSAEYVGLNTVHTSELYDEYDALVTAYPDFFTRQADLGNVTRIDDSEVFAIRSYRLDFTKKALFDHEPSNDEVVASSNNLYAKYYGKPRKILVNGGMHGEEKTPCWGLMLAIKAILESSDPWATFIKNNFVLEIIPCLNPAGWDMCRRGNCNNLVLNRDEAINEPETLMYMDWIAANKDAFILIDVHGTQGRFAYAPVNRAEPICDQVLKTTLQLSTFFYPNWKEFWESQYTGYGTTYAPFLLAKFSKMDGSSWTLGRLNYRMFHECGMREFAIETPDNFYSGVIGSNDLRNCKITKDLFINYLQFVCGAEKIRM